jgi:hypothetical protein
LPVEISVQGCRPISGHRYGVFRGE